MKKSKCDLYFCIVWKCAKEGGEYWYADEESDTTMFIEEQKAGTINFYYATFKMLNLLILNFR